MQICEHSRTSANIKNKAAILRANINEHAESQKCRNTDLRQSRNICETQNKIANVYETLRANINEHAERQKYGNAEMQICENLRTSAKFCEQQHGCEDAETKKHTNIGMETCSSTERQKYGNAEMQICENLRTSTKIKNKTSNISSRNMQKDRNALPFLLPPPLPP